MPCGVEPHGLGNRTPAQVLWSGTVPDGIAPLRLSHTDIRPDTSEQCSFQRGYGDASEARTRTLQRERLMTLPIRLWHRTWWNQRESNPRPPACKAGALPIEICSQIEAKYRGVAPRNSSLFVPSRNLSARDFKHLVHVFGLGGPCWTRTSDTLINSQVLCQLS